LPHLSGFLYIGEMWHGDVARRCGTEMWQTKTRYDLESWRVRL
jgi:hypothetical protein